MVVYDLHFFRRNSICSLENTISSLIRQAFVNRALLEYCLWFGFVFGCYNGCQPGSLQSPTPGYKKAAKAISLTTCPFPLVHFTTPSRDQKPERIVLNTVLELEIVFLSYIFSFKQMYLQL